MPDFTHETGEFAIRFHRDSEWYLAGTEANFRVYRVHANRERAVELFLHFSASLESPVDVVLEHRRDGSRWHGELLALEDVREAIGRLRWPLASYGGVELTLVTADDQLSLMPSLELIICSRADAWPARLATEGVPMRDAAPTPGWPSTDVPWSDAPELTAALDLVAQRLALVAEL